MRSISDVHTYQNDAIDRGVTQDHIALFAGLGLGKTLMGLGIVASKIALGMGGKTLIVAPRRVAINGWHREAAQWDFLKHLTFSIACGTAVQRRVALAKNADVYVINYENLQWLIDNYYKKSWKWEQIVLDESSLVKNSKTKRFRYLKAICQDRIVTPTRGKNKGISRVVKAKVKKVVLLTATPATKGLENLWSQIYLLDGGKRLGRSLREYMMTYFKPVAFEGTQYVKYEPIEGAKEKIYKKIEDLVHVLRTEDYLDMPDLIQNDIVVQLPKNIRDDYKKLEKEFLLQLSEEDEIYAANEASLGNKLLQFCNGAVYVGDPQDPDYVKKFRVVHDEKLNALAELYEAAKDKEPLLVCYWYESDLIRLKKRFPDAVVMDKDGSCIADWNDGKIDMLLIQPASAGMGLNLQTGGHRMVFFSLTWSLEYVLQVIGRIYRQGQRHAVTITNIVVENSREQRVTEALRNNAETQEELLEYLKR